VKQALLEIKDLHTYFYVKAGTVKAIDGVNLTLDSGTKMGIVGESGSGKTTMALSIIRMVRPPGTIEGQICLDGVDLLKLKNEEMRKMRLSQISYMPQGAMNSLNPVARIKTQIVDGMIDHGIKFGSRSEMDRQVSELLEVAELPAKVANMYPHELSGGMKQRACLAIAIALHPKLLIADEPTSALDVVIQREVMETITGLVKDLNLAMIRSLPVLGNRGNFEGIPGIPPSVINPGPGCPFAARCPDMMAEICPKAMPPSIEIKSGRWVACHLYDGAMQ
jgi:oligopeptide/dipeptide ABC transporter ATP-binding protein